MRELLTIISALQIVKKELLDIIQINPYQNPPPYEKIVGDLEGRIQEE